MEIIYYVCIHVDGSRSTVYDNPLDAEGYKCQFPTVEIVELTGTIKTNIDNPRFF